MVSTLLSILARAPLWAGWSDVASRSLLRVSGLVKATAQCFRWATNWGAIPDLGKASCFKLLFKARTVSTFCSQIANRSSMSLASPMALRRAAANSLGRSQLAYSAASDERSTHGPIADD